MVPTLSRPALITLSTMTFHRFVAIGDSYTEGIGDPDPTRPNGVRGWADRVAEVLATQSDDFGYANLAIRGKKMAAVLEEQLEPALELKPDLISIHGAGNDFIRPSIDIDAIVRLIDIATRTAIDAGATVMLSTHGDGGSQGVFGAIRGRVAIFNELLREVADRRGAVLIDNWRLREGRDLRYWDEDRLHLGPAGHQGVAINVLDTLGIPHALLPINVPAVIWKSKRQSRVETVQWARDHFGPWLGRRMRGRSTGDGITPKRPELAPI
jgi:lysophospholipase L1-like esterase